MILIRLTGLSMALNTPGVETSRIGVEGDKGNPLCRIIRGTKEGLRRCEGCDRRQHALAGAEGRARLYTCHAGFLDMAIPIMIQSRHVATVSSGQVLTERHSDAGLARTLRRLKWLNVPEGRLRTAYRRAPWLPRDRLTHVMRLLELFSRELCDTAWRIRELEAQLERPSICRGRAVIEERFSDPELNLADVAAHAGLSRAHFSHLFHRETGVTFTHHVQSRRVQEARRLLAETSRTITEICFDCGFNSLTHFNRVFRRSAGCSPSNFRHSGASR